MMKTKHAFLAALLTPLTYSAEPQPVEPIVRLSDGTVVTHKLRIDRITFGFSDKGGGYLNHLDLGDGKNIVSPLYGRGWQGSVRDLLHSGRYNPTQAGFTDDAGTPVKLILNDKRLTIPPFNLPLYGDPVFDFTEHEDLAPDFKGYSDHGNSDTDGIDESSCSQDDELRSEFDFEGFYEDATHLYSGNIPILRFYSRYTYARAPRAILQFGKNAIKKDGKPVITEPFRVGDISQLLPGNQQATDVDLSKIVFTAYGIRLLTNSGYTTPMWHENGKWNSISLEQIKGRGNEKTFEIVPSKNQRKQKSPILKDQFLLLAKGDDPKTSPAIAMYSPQHIRTNAKQIVGLDRGSGKEIYREDRRESGIIMFSHVTPSQVDIRSRFFLSGMLAPDHGDSNAFESLENDTFILFGTPEEILKATRFLHMKSGGAN